MNMKNLHVEKQNLQILSHHWTDQKHHKPGSAGFQNIWGTGIFKINPWKAGSFFMNKAMEFGKDIPAQLQNITTVELEKPIQNYRLFWLGHSSVLIQTGKLNIITDPMFSYRASPVSFAGPKRAVRLPIQPENLKKVDVVVVSHDHYDHLDKESILLLNKQYAPLFLVPLKVGKLFREWKIEHYYELDWWQYIEYQNHKFHFTPSKHFSARGVFDRNQTLWGSWFVESLESGRKFYFAGDTAYASHFSEIAEKLGGPDVAIIPIGAYQPRWFMKEIHIDPYEAVQAYLDLKADYMFSIHFGTFNLAAEPMDEPPKLVKQITLEKKLLQDKIKILPVGAPFHV